MRKPLRLPIACAAVGMLTVCAPWQAGAQTVAEKKALLEQLDFNGDHLLDEVEIGAGLQYRLDTYYKKTPKLDLASFKGHYDKARAWYAGAKGQIEIAAMMFQDAQGPPLYSIDQLANDPGFDPKKRFSLDEPAANKPGAPVTGAQSLAGNDLGTLKWKPTHDKWTDILRVRRTIDDLNSSTDASKDPTKQDTTKGALVSYASDFNLHSQQWAVHGVLGLDLAEQLGVANGLTMPAADGRPAITMTAAPPDGQVDRQWVRPSVALDKVDTSRGKKDEIDALVFRLTAGQRYVSGLALGKFIDGFIPDAGVTFATDTSGEREVFGGELNFRPFKIQWGHSGFGLNSGDLRPFNNPLFWMATDLVVHAEGGTVIDDAGVAELRNQRTFFRLGGTASLKLGLAMDDGKTWIQPGSPFELLTRLTLSASFQYGDNVLDNGPDVDLFIGSVDWKIDEAGHYTLTAEYRNGRSALVLQRDNRVTVGIGVKY